MADLNLIQTPPYNSDGLSLSASRNPVQFRFSTDTVGSPTKAFAFLWISGPSVASGTEVVFNGTTYTAQDDPEFGQFLTTTANTVEEVALHLVVVLRDDPNNYEYEFNAITSGFPVPVVAIVAKKPGTAYDITLTAGTGFTIMANVGGSDQYRGQQFEGYKVWAELYTNDALAFAQHLNQAPPQIPGHRWMTYYDLKFLESNTMVFDVGGMCDGEVDYTPPRMAAGIFRQEVPTRAFFIEYGESFIPVGMTNEIRMPKGRSNVFYAVNGALETLAENDLSDYISRQPDQKFLTDQPGSRAVRLTDKTWLCFIHYSPNGTQRWVGAFIQAVFYDDSTAVAGTYFKTMMGNGYQTMRIDPSSWAMETFEQTQGKLVKRYDVYLVESTNAAFTGAYKFSELRSFTIDRLCPSDGILEFAWLETIGGWTGFSFYGELLTDIERQPRLFDRGRAVDYGPNDQMLAVQQVDFNHVNTAFSGTVDETTFNWLRDSLLKSAAVYIVAGNSMIPIVVTGHSAKSSTAEFTFQLSITFRLSAPVNVNRS